VEKNKFHHFGLLEKILPTPMDADRTIRTE